VSTPRTEPGTPECRKTGCLRYAQHIAAITEPASDDVRDSGTTVSVMLGTVPVTLPEPLDVSRGATRSQPTRSQQRCPRLPECQEQSCWAGTGK
jgi:hypothetical protein